PEQASSSSVQAREFHRNPFDGDPVMISQPETITALAAASREQCVFEGLLLPGEERVRSSEIRRVLADRGLHEDDPRLGTFRELLRDGSPGEFSYEEFLHHARACMLFLEQVLTGELVIPEFGEFCVALEGVFEAARSDTGGRVADY